MLYEGEIIDDVLYSRAHGNAIASNEVIFKLWSVDEIFREKNGVHFKNVISFYSKTFSYFLKKCSHF